jgi:hypothetical protein
MANGSQAVPAAPAWIVNVVDILMSLFKQQKANGIWAFILWRKMIAEACLELANARCEFAMAFVNSLRRFRIP